MHSDRFYDDLIDAAIELADPTGENDEYNRGIVEVISYVIPPETESIQYLLDRLLTGKSDR